MITETVHLTGGIFVKGQRYKVVVMRENPYKDYLDAQRESKEQGALFYSGLLIVKAIVEVGNQDDKGQWIDKVPGSDVDLDALAMTNEVDIERLQDCRDVIKKKLSMQRSG